MHNIDTYINIYTCIINIYIYIIIFMYCIYIYVCVFVCTFFFLNNYIYIYIYDFMYIYIYYIYTLVCLCDIHFQVKQISGWGRHAGRGCQPPSMGGGLLAASLVPDSRLLQSRTL
jgi:hypothetical protein